MSKTNRKPVTVQKAASKAPAKAVAIKTSTSKPVPATPAAPAPAKAAAPVKFNITVGKDGSICLQGITSVSFGNVIAKLGGDYRVNLAGTLENTKPVKQILGRTRLADMSWTSQKKANTFAKELVNAVLASRTVG